MTTTCKHITVVVISLLALSCSAVRECREPQFTPPETIAGADTDSLTVADVEWWEFYADPALRDIITRTLANNRRVQAAAARIEQARHLYRIARANRLPNLNFLAPFNVETNDYYGEEKNQFVDPELGLKANIRWELDLWGNLRWAKRKSGAEYEATVLDERAMRMMLVAEAATAYFRLVALDNELNIVQHTLVTRSEGLKQAKLRFEGGLTSEIVYRQAQVEYASTAALIPGLQRSIEATENALSLLMGENPDFKVVRSGSPEEWTFPERLPVGVPSQLLERRPDVQAAQQRLQAAMAGVGIAWADRFPRIVIDLTGGLENNDFRGLLRSPFSYVAETLTAPIFGFGRKKARYKAAVAAYDESRLNYEQKVLEVFREADDAVVALRTARTAAQLRLELRDAARKYVDLTQLQYIAGSINYLDVMDAQRRYLDAQIGLSNAVRDQHLALVQLYKALGGGWQEDATENNTKR